MNNSRRNTNNSQMTDTSLIRVDSEIEGMERTDMVDDYEESDNFAENLFKKQPDRSNTHQLTTQQKLQHKQAQLQLDQIQVDT